MSCCFHPLISAPGLCAKLDSTYADPPPVRPSHDVVLQHLLTPPSTRACLQINFRPITALKLWHIYTLRVSIIPPMSISSQYFPCFVRNLQHVFLKKANLHLTESVNVSLNDHQYSSLRFFLFFDRLLEKCKTWDQKASYVKGNAHPACYDIWIMNTLICWLVSPENMQILVSRRDVKNVIINLPQWDLCTACILLQLNCRMEQATTTITLKCQLHCMLKLAMQLIICMLQDSGTHFLHLKSVNLSMLNSSVKRDVYQLRGLYHVGNEPCSVLIKHVVLPGIFQVRLTVLPEYH